MKRRARWCGVPYPKPEIRNRDRKKVMQGQGQLSFHTLLCSYLEQEGKGRKNQMKSRVKGVGGEGKSRPYKPCIQARRNTHDPPAPRGTTVADLLAHSPLLIWKRKGNLRLHKSTKEGGRSGGGRRARIPMERRKEAVGVASRIQKQETEIETEEKDITLTSAYFCCGDVHERSVELAKLRPWRVSINYSSEKKDMTSERDNRFSSAVYMDLHVLVTFWIAGSLRVRRWLPYGVRRETESFIIVRDYWEETNRERVSTVE
ncbi:hypothetical protein K438DRAFT_2074164 [Mycena galopus ATCC 62051]|nr:hypothetical protein K438DRAFT_2074164 [Mycena galopus ATCC 62051]